MRYNKALRAVFTVILSVALLLGGCGIIPQANIPDMSREQNSPNDTADTSGDTSDEARLPQTETEVCTSDTTEDEASSDALLPTTAPYTLAWISDTQHYSASYPEIYLSMTDWIVKNKEERNIKAVVHTGDVVDTYGRDKQWDNAASAMSRLDGAIPYVVLAGNHDVGANSGELDYTRFSACYGKASAFGEQESTLWYKDGESRALLLDVGGTGYIILALGWGADEAAFSWANDVLSQYRDRIAILATHKYLRADLSVSTNGKLLFENVVKPNPNIRLVLCGHNHGAGRIATEIDDDGDGTTDRTVWQLIANYQDEANGGNGFIRLLTIDEEKGSLSVKTYSPYTDTYNCLSAEEDEFSLYIEDWFR